MLRQVTHPAWSLRVVMPLFANANKDSRNNLPASPLPPSVPSPPTPQRFTVLARPSLTRRNTKGLGSLIHGVHFDTAVHFNVLGAEFAPKLLIWPTTVFPRFTVQGTSQQCKRRRTHIDAYSTEAAYQRMLDVLVCKAGPLIFCAELLVTTRGKCGPKPSGRASSPGSAHPQYNAYRQAWREEISL